MMKIANGLRPFRAFVIFIFLHNASHYAVDTAPLGQTDFLINSVTFKETVLPEQYSKSLEGTLAIA